MSLFKIIESHLHYSVTKIKTQVYNLKITLIFIKPIFI